MGANASGLLPLGSSSNGGPVSYEVVARQAREWGERCREGADRQTSPKPDLTVLCWNAYLIPKWFVSTENATCQRQAGRASGIGSAIVAIAPDVSCMQEVWGSSMPKLEQQISHQYSVIPWCRSWGFTALDTTAQYLASRGGLWVANRTDSTVFVDSRWRSFAASNTRSKKGIVAVRYRVYLNGMAAAGEARRDMAQQQYKAMSIFDDRRSSTGAAGGTTTGSAAGSARGTGGNRNMLDEALMRDADAVRNLIVCNVHLDPTNEHGVLDKQVAEIADFLCKDVAGDALFCPATKDFAVLLVGDFNFAPDSACCRLLKSSLKLRDLYAGRWSKPDETSVGFDAGSDRVSLPEESIDATYDYRTNGLAMYANCGRIDQQFAVDGLYPGDGRSVTFARLDCIHAEIMRQPKGSELSDHWPVYLALRFTRPEDVARTVGGEKGGGGTGPRSRGLSASAAAAPPLMTFGPVPVWSRQALTPGPDSETVADRQHHRPGESPPPSSSAAGRPAGGNATVGLRAAGATGVSRGALASVSRGTAVEGPGEL